MTLALEFGRPLGEIKQMPQREFVRWMAYSARKGLPSRRVELYLAQIAWLIAQTMGGAKESTLADFLFDEATDDADEKVDELEAAKAAFDFKPRNQKED